MTRLSTLARSGWRQTRRLPLRLAVRYVAPERPRRFPTSIQIEATSKCNLRCPSCSHSREAGAGEHLTPDILETIIDRLPFTPAIVRLSGIGEPLLNPQFLTLVDVLAARSIDCDFITNGTLLTPTMREELLSRPNIAEVIISCDGAHKETFERCRLGASFERWCEFVGDFLAETNRDPRPTLRITSSTVASRQNLGEIADVIRFGARLGFDRMMILAPIPVDEISASLCPSSAEMATVSRDRLEATAAAAGVEIGCAFARSSVPPVSIPRCLQPWEGLFIRATGDVSSCCALFGSDRASVMGNILEQDFAAIWCGERFGEFRRTSASGTNALCRVCPYY